VIGKKCCHQAETSKFKTACAKADRIASRIAGLRKPSPAWGRQRGFGSRRSG
jgi:hypothetical protein